MNGAVALFILPCLPIATGLFLPKGPWWLFAVGAIFLCAGLVLFPLAWRRRQAGPALIHLFGNGAVLERTKGEIFALPYAETPVDHVRWREAIEGGEHKQLRQHLWITLPDSRTVMLDGRGKAEPQDLSFIAERWGLSPEPRLLEEAPKAHPLW